MIKERKLSSVYHHNKYIIKYTTYIKSQFSHFLTIFSWRDLPELPVDDLEDLKREVDFPAAKDV